jgi:hypothetical protein
MADASANLAHDLAALARLDRSSWTAALTVDALTLSEGACRLLADVWAWECAQRADVQMQDGG